MATDHIRYDLLVQDAFRGIFRRVLNDAAVHGLPGEHHFYVTFKTHAPGVVLSDRLKTEYPDQMTIILQHQFWDLRVHDTGFEVGLSFRRIPEKLEIPFAAVTGFFDPSVNFGAEFTAEGDVEASDAANLSDMSDKSKGVSPPPYLTDVSAPESQERPPLANNPPPAAKNKPRPAQAAPPSEIQPPEETSAEGEAPKVVSIDAFRKKTP